ncbi:MAG: Endonuclease, partial [uncultured Pseudonocardia sp.]
GSEGRARTPRRGRRGAVPGGAGPHRPRPQLAVPPRRAGRDRHRLRPPRRLRGEDAVGHPVRHGRGGRHRPQGPADPPARAAVARRAPPALDRGPLRRVLRAHRAGRRAGARPLRGRVL